MGAGYIAVRNAKLARELVAKLAKRVGGTVEYNVWNGMNFWGVPRKINLKVTLKNKVVVWLDVLWQEGGGTAYQKAMCKLHDIKTGDIPNRHLLFGGGGIPKKFAATIDGMGAVRIDNALELLCKYADVGYVCPQSYYMNTFFGVMRELDDEVRLGMEKAEAAGDEAPEEEFEPLMWNVFGLMDEDGMIDGKEDDDDRDSLPMTADEWIGYIKKARDALKGSST